MARKSPRSRKKAASGGRMPGSNRPRKSPRKTSRKKAARTGSAEAHRLRGARTKPETPASSTRKKASATRKKTAAGRKKAAASGKKAAARRKAPARSPKSSAGAKKTAAKRTSGRRTKFTPPDSQRVAHVLGILDGLYPNAMTALEFKTPLHLLIATILSAQCTDERVNKVTPVLFEQYPDARALAEATQEDLEEVVRSTGFYRNKAKSIRACCADIVAKHGGEVPRTMEALTALRGVGRKTANVVLGNAFGIPGLVVDTHVTRLSNRLGFTNEKDAVKIEHALMPIVPKDQWTVFAHWLILHGRKVCNARKPYCSICPLAPHCPRDGVTASQ
jgi:endonuclease-3